MAIRRDGFIAFNPYVAGNKRYGALGTSNPTSGPVDKSGYAERERRNRVKRNALLAYQQAGLKGQKLSADYLRKAAK